MIRAEEIKNLYEEISGYKLYLDYGEIDLAVREGNQEIYPVCGIFKMQPITLTAINAPRIGISSAEIELIVPPKRLDEVRRVLNTTVITELNGVTVTLQDATEYERSYSVSFTAQTCTTEEKSVAGVWYGEYVTVRQIISFVIIENGVSSYETSLKIDGYDVPILTLSETKVHTTSVYPDACANGHTLSEQEAYGIDFTTPYVKSELCEIFRSAVNEPNGNKGHCVEITKNGITNAYVMAITSASDSIQPPSNIGFNISLTELNTRIGRFDGRWKRYLCNKSIVPQSVIFDKLISSSDKEATVFWGDGSFEKINVEKKISYTHSPSHTSDELYTVLAEREGVGYFYGIAMNNAVAHSLYGISWRLDMSKLTPHGLNIHRDSGEYKLYVSWDGYNNALNSVVSADTLEHALENSLTFSTGNAVGTFVMFFAYTEKERPSEQVKLSRVLKDALTFELTRYTHENQKYHVYSDGKNAHDVLCFTTGLNHSMRKIRPGEDLLGKERTIVLDDETNLVHTNGLPLGYIFTYNSMEENSPEATVLFGITEKEDIFFSDKSTRGLICDGERAFFYSGNNEYLYIDDKSEYGYVLKHNKRFICPISGSINFVKDNSLVSFYVRLEDMPEEVVS